MVPAPYAPERNEMEPLFGVAKHREMPHCSFKEVSELIPDVDQAFQNISDRLSSRY